MIGRRRVLLLAAAVSVVVFCWLSISLSLSLKRVEQRGCGVQSEYHADMG